MALDEALMGRARSSGESVLRVYQWAGPALSLGRNQRAAGLYDLAAARNRGVVFVRRPTGGRALLHHREITYSVTAPATTAASTRESYDWINRLLVDGLSQLGVDARIVEGGTRAALPDATPCFASPAAGELVVGGRKLVGSAQWRDSGAMLQHGSILIEDDQALAASLLIEKGPASPRPATLVELLGRAPDAGEVMSALVKALDQRCPEPASPLALDEALAADSEQLKPRYRSDAWTWRR